MQGRHRARRSGTRGKAVIFSLDSVARGMVRNIASNLERSQKMNASAMVKIWDPLIRIFHWSLVAAFAIAYLSAEDASALHRWSGYAVAGLVAVRVLWGVIGPRHARFSDFVRAPSAVMQYARDFLRRRPARYLGHNPLGGVMVIALLVALLGTVASGVATYSGHERGTDISASAVERGQSQAPATPRAVTVSYGDRDEEDSAWEELHEFFASFTVILVLMHVTGVLASSLLHRENLVRSMVTGTKRR